MIPIYSPSFGKNEKDNLLECIDTGWISSQGGFIEQFENNFSKWNAMQYGVATSSCTSALHLALVALGIGKNDEVICPDLTFIAPANMIRLTGAEPVLVDVHPINWGIDPLKLEEKITSKTKAIIVVHAYGHPADMDAISVIAKKHNLYIIEDVAEAPGAKYKGKLVGTMGDASCYSFYANKIMTTGEGGIVLTNDKTLDKQMRIYRDHGMSREKRYVYVVAGFNYRMTNMQAAIGLAQMEMLDEILALRREQMDFYYEKLSNVDGISLRKYADWCEPVHWMMTLTLDDKYDRDSFLDYMKNNGIDCRQMINPVHHADHFKSQFSDDDFINSINISKQSAHLPSGLGLNENQISEIADIIKKFKDNG